MTNQIIKIERHQVTTWEQEAIVGSNPEWADMSNPEGHIYRMVYSACVTLDSGRRFHHAVQFRDEDEADALVAKIQNKGVINTQHWVEDEHGAYGSTVWQHRDELRRQRHIMSGDQTTVRGL